MSERLIVIGYAALEGTLDLIRQNGERLKGRFSPYFLEKALRRTEEEITALRLAGMPAVSRSRLLDECILNELWHFSEDEGTGFKADFLKLPLLQETIEICEALDENPYRLRCGAGVLVIGNADEIRDLLPAVHIADIGYITEDKARILSKRRTDTYLPRPEADRER